MWYRYSFLIYFAYLNNVVANELPIYFGTKKENFSNVKIDCNISRNKVDIEVTKSNGLPLLNLQANHIYSIDKTKEHSIILNKVSITDTQNNLWTINKTRNDNAACTLLLKPSKEGTKLNFNCQFLTATYSDGTSYEGWAHIFLDDKTVILCN